jgi:hypothetical protein
MRLAIAGMIVGGIVMSAAGAPGHQCDPYTRQTQIAPTTPLAKTCGNGRVDDFTRSCVQLTHGGCGRDDTTEVRCEPGRETCDGKALDGATCVSLRFGGGTLGCKPSCEGFDMSRCSLCAGPGCRELAVTGALAPTGGFRLIARGNVVRAFWSATVQDAPHDVTATVGDNGRLIDAPIDLGMIETQDIVALSKVWVTATDDGHDTVVKVISDRGVATVKTGIPSPSGKLYVLPVSGVDAALVIAGDIPWNAFDVRMIDGTGKLVPLPDKTIYARGTADRVALVPIPATPTKVGVGTKQMAIEPRAGDRVLAWMHDSPGCPTCAVGGAALVHDGVRQQMQLSGSLDPPELAIAIDGTPVHFARDADRVGTETFARPAPPAPFAGNGPFGAFATDSGIQRVKTKRGELLAATFDLDVEGYRVAIAAR